MKEGSVAACLVTFNRLGLLRSVLPAVLNQSRKPDKVFVINNSSTDGTAEWLKEQEGITVITQDNTGSSGGQYTGIKTAFEQGFEWIWVMDDDVVPHPDALVKLLEIADENTVVSPLRLTSKNHPYLNDTIEFNMTNPFKSFWKQIVSTDLLQKKALKATGITFEGPLFNRKLVEKIGLPRFDFFIYGDDSEYFLRAERKGFSIVINTEALFSRLIDPPEGFKFDWKSYYQARNQIIIDRLYGNFAVRIVRPVLYIFKWLAKCRNLGQIKTMLSAFRDGYFYREQIPEKYK